MTIFLALTFLSGHRFHCHPGGTNLKIPSRSIKDIYLAQKEALHNQTLNLTHTSHTKQGTNPGKKQVFYFLILTREHRKFHLPANNLYFLKALILQKKFFCGGRASKKLTSVKQKKKLQSPLNKFSYISFSRSINYTGILFCCWCSGYKGILYAIPPNLRNTNIEQLDP